MAPRRRYTKREKATAVVNAEMSSVMAASEATGIPRTTIAYWLDQPEFVALRQKTREEAADGFVVLMHMAQDRLRQLIPVMEPRDLITLMGVATDKGELITGHATARSEHRDVTGSLPDDQREALADAIEEWLAQPK